MAADCNSPNKHKSPPSSAIPWAQVVRGGDSEAKASAPRSPSNQSENNNNDPLVNKENENKEAANPSIIGGEVSWPALSECTRSNSPKITALPQVSQVLTIHFYWHIVLSMHNVYSYIP